MRTIEHHIINYNLTIQQGACEHFWIQIEDFKIISKTIFLQVRWESEIQKGVDITLLGHYCY